MSEETRIEWRVLCNDEQVASDIDIPLRPLIRTGIILHLEGQVFRVVDVEVDALNWIVVVHVEQVSRGRGLR